MLPLPVRVDPAAPARIGLAVARGWAGYLTTLARRGFSPFAVVADIGEFWSAVTDSEAPRWAHDWPVAFDDPLARVLDCGDPSQAPSGVPILVLPPQAGTHSCIVDHSRGRSLIDALRAGGATRVYAVDWLPETPETAEASIVEHLAVVDRAVEHAGGRVIVVGGSQGGWLGTIYTALQPERVAALAIAGAPIDFHAGRIDLAALSHLPRAAARSVTELFYDAARSLGAHPTDPVGEFERLMALVGALGDHDAVRDLVAAQRWFRYTQEMPRAFRRWIFEHLFAANELVDGTLRVGDRSVDLAEIRCPVHLLAGEEDVLATPRQVTALARHVSTPPEDIRRTVVDDGHLGLFVGTTVLRSYWTPLARELASTRLGDAAHTAS